MRREISLLESDVLRKDNNRKLLVDFMGDAAFTMLTCDSLASLAYRGYDELKLLLLAIGVVGSYVYYNDTLRRVSESVNLQNNYSELYDNEESLKLIRRK